MVKKRCHFCGHTMDIRGVLGTESKYKGKWTHKGCLEQKLMREQNKTLHRTVRMYGGKRFVEVDGKKVFFDKTQEIILTPTKAGKYIIEDYRAFDGTKVGKTIALWVRKTN